MPDSDWPTWPSVNDDGPWYAWPGLEPQLFPVPCDGYIWKPLKSDPSIYFPVRYAPPKPKWVAEEPPLRTALYRLFDGAGTLLYIGISGSPEKRWVHHSENKPWWSEVARVEFAWLNSRAEALYRESEAIRAEKPRHNIQHNGTLKSAAAPSNANRPLDLPIRLFQPSLPAPHRDVATGDG